MSEILDAIRKAVGDDGTRLTVFDAEVKSVDETARTCTIETIGGNTPIEINDVRLIPVVDDSFLIIPAVGSHIIVIYSNKIIPFIVQFSEIKKIILTIGKSTLDIEDGLFTFNGGDNDGIPKSKETAARLNKIEDDINKLKQAFTSWTPVPNDGGAALKGAAAAWSGSTLTRTTKDDIKNVKIKQ